MSKAVVAQRHPNFLGKASRYASAADDFEPPQRLRTGPLKDNLWGIRTAFGELHYMVYDLECKGVLASGKNPEIAGYSALQRLQREARLPESYNPRLAGCTFAQGVEAGSNFVMHSVVAATGEVIGESENGRDQACEIASRAMVQRIDADDVTMEEFSGICHVVAVERVRAKGMPWAMYDDEIGRDCLRKQLAEIWRADPLARQEGASSGVLQGRADMDKFILGAESALLAHAAEMGGQVSCIRLTFCGDERQVFMCFSSARGMSRETIQRTVYGSYCEEIDERKARAHEGRLRVREV